MKFSRLKINAEQLKLSAVIRSKANAEVRVLIRTILNGTL